MRILLRNLRIWRVHTRLCRPTLFRLAKDISVSQLRFDRPAGFLAPLLTVRGTLQAAVCGDGVVTGNPSVFEYECARHGSRE